MRILCWIPSYLRYLKEEGYEIRDRHVVFAWFIYTLHKKRQTKYKNGDDVYHMSHSDFVNIMGWKSFKNKWNEDLEILRKIFRIGQHGGYWTIQFTEETIEHRATKNRKQPSYDWIYLEDVDAIAIHFYLQGLMRNGDLLSDWQKGQDMDEFYKEHPLTKSEYDIMKFRSDLY